METQTDVIIVGSGSAGLCAGLWLSRLGIDFRILEKRTGPLNTGQADGVQCRTVEVFESFGLDGELTKDAYWVNETVFWSGEDSIQRVRRTADTPPGISWQPHVILNQARLNEILIKEMKQPIEYGVAVKDVRIDYDVESWDQNARPVTATAIDASGKEVIYKAKYLLGCDGAHSTVRKALGYDMIGDTSDAVWGVMDIFPRTDFPDIRKKTSIRSAAGNLIIIPREGGRMVRFYIEMPKGTDAQVVKLEDLQAKAKQIFSQFPIEFAHTHWYSAYSIGQRLASNFSKADRVFLTGDACHTHSPKAGQGMNLSLQDGYNIGWKLAAVLRGEAGAALLKTYTQERGQTAKDLIDFDRELTTILVANEGQDPNKSSSEYSDHFIKSLKYTAGLTTTYPDSVITNAKGSTQALALNVTVGMRFPSAQVVRYCDARAMQLSRALPSDGRWRLMVFAGDITNSICASRLRALDHFLRSPGSPIIAFMKEFDYFDSTIEPILVLSGDRVALEDQNAHIPKTFTPINGEHDMRDLSKVYIDDHSYNNGHGYAYDNLGIDQYQGAIVVVRPDQYVAMVTHLGDYAGLRRFFGGAM
ncbi:putative phenol 2-monooxygenase [Microthyrium microscopicum]|uniref:Putative phenol 2-monooxygenase n=1 Tax=Microthyrium microscopicum TaxID=703497 RepID=A0A6A6U4D2_9PEZI|nr:putative phenol 2-monooxygenase [Microthyrium microscopicum]